MTNLNKLITAFTVIVATIFFLGFVYLSFTKENSPTSAPIVTIESPTATPTPIASTPPGWQTYELNGVSIAHPADFVIRTDVPDMITLYKHGPTQSLGTEVYDGVILNILKETRTEPTLNEYVDNQWATKTSDPIYTSVSQVSEIEIAGLKGYAFSTSALGEFDNIFLPWGEAEHLYITTLVADPGNLGFQEIVEQILNSIKKI